MAKCERCGTGGFDMREMSADMTTQQFIGPCCTQERPAQKKEEVQYGLELSSHMGLRAYISYGGLNLEFKKTNEELKQWMEKPREVQQVEQQEVPQPPLVEMSATNSEESQMKN